MTEGKAKAIGRGFDVGQRVLSCPRLYLMSCFIQGDLISRAVARGLQDRSRILVSS